MSMTLNVRKLVLTAHITFSVGLLGSIATFLALAIVGLTTQEAQLLRAVYLAMDLTARLVIVPMALGSLLSGLIQSLGTSWGLFQHKWVLAKFLLTAFAFVILLVKIELVAYGAHLAAEAVLSRADLRAVGRELMIHAAGGLLVLLVPAVLSVYKPWGLTPYGRRKQQPRRAPPQQAHRPRRPSPVPSGGVDVLSRRKSITITLRRVHMIGIAVMVLVLHFVILHLTGFGLGGH
jgi:hypothetical protein